MNEERHQIILFYKYVHIDDPEAVKAWQEDICARLELKGRGIIAQEGINITFEGTKENIAEYIKELEKDKRFLNIHFKLSASNGNAFPRLSIKVRKEIVSLHLGTCDIDPNQITGVHLAPAELHEWIKNGKEFYIVDMRNVYEHKVGHFKNSILPPIENFRDLPKVVEQIYHLKNKIVLTVCTGGVRCEKASGFLIKGGFTDVYQLDGGIVSYMEKYPNEDFQGKLYVFDGRVTMGFYTDDSKHEIIGKCDHCGEQSENYVNCANPVCHRHFIACENCVTKGDGNVFCMGGCVLSRHGRKISKVEANLI
ncbi:MAG: rhodanese-related sulfurtransferase [Candidatus Pacebacteria bacterium]|nr:rhodanese-related sulfurtransferase [Candidatus Paceibacterota bacterium]